MSRIFFPIFLLSTVSLIFICGKAEGFATEEDFINLYDTLLTDYKRHVRPIANQSEPVGVRFGFGLLAIEEIDDVKQQVDILALIFLQWNDKNLIWSPDAYGGIDSLFLDEEKIWAPKVYTLNSPSNEALLSSLPTQHMVHADGNVKFSSSGSIKTICSLKMTYFPFDSHACEFSFGILDSSTKEVILLPGFLGARVVDGYLEDGEWDVSDVNIKKEFVGGTASIFSNYIITVTFKRRPAYYIVNVILPTVVLGILSLLTFIVPAESGERLSYTLTTLLSLSVYIPYIGGLIPTSSVDMPAVLLYLISLFLINAMCVIMSTIIIAVRWSDVVDVNDFKKTVFIFGISFTIKKRCGNKTFARLPKKTRVGVDTLEVKSAWVSQNSDEGDLKSNQNGTRKNNEHKSHPMGNGDLLFGEEEHVIGREPRRLETKGGEFLDVHSRPGAVKESHVDPDVMAVSDLVSRYSFIALLISFVIITFLTFCRLYYQSF